MDYNGERPHSKLGWQTPNEFALTSRRALALRNAKGSAPAPVASPTRQGKANAGTNSTPDKIWGQGHDHAGNFREEAGLLKRLH